jgi:lipoyl(octanoyl) transferase
MERSAHRKLHVAELQRLGYPAACELQERLVERCVESGRIENFLLPVEHPPVITIGRSGKNDEVLAAVDELRSRGVEIFETNRGGRTTFHGPGQLVMYPIIDLKARGEDLHKYLRDLERWLVRLLAELGVDAGVNPPHTGVWVHGSKIASIGIAVRKWVAYHGVALNVSPDLSFFRLIVPCGIKDVKMTSIAEVTGGKPSLTDVAERAVRLFCEEFDFREIVNHSSLEVVEAQ